MRSVPDSVLVSLSSCLSDPHPDSDLYPSFPRTCTSRGSGQRATDLVVNLPAGLIPSPPLPARTGSARSTSVTPPQYVGPIRQDRSQRQRRTGSGQHCRPSRVQRLHMGLITDFHQLEEEFGEFQAWRTLREELEMHCISVYHDVLACQNCDLTQSPVVYCSQSRHHPLHSLHVCPMTRSCPCSRS